MSEPVDWNLNHGVIVVPTEYGAAWYNKYYADFYAAVNMPASLRVAPAVAGEPLELQMWSAMHIFGPLMYMGVPHEPFSMLVKIKDVKEVNELRIRLREAEAEIERLRKQAKENK